MCRHALKFLLAAVLLAGCTSAGRGVAVPPPAETPPVSAPVSAPAPAADPLPRIVHSEIRTGEEFPGGGAALGELDLAPGERPVPTDNFWFSLRLEPVPDAAWFAGVKLEGAEFDPVRSDLFHMGLFEVLVKQGQPGSTVTVTLPPVEGALQNVYRLKRETPPTARLQVQVDGKWEPANPRKTYVEGPLKLRLDFTAEMDRASVEASLKRPGYGTVQKDPRQEPVAFSWLDGRTLTAQWTEAPAVVNWSLVGARGQNGLYLTGPIPAVHTGPAPYIASIDRSGENELKLMETVPEVSFAQAAQGGQKLMVWALDLYGGQSGFISSRAWAIDLKAKTAKDRNGPAEFVVGTGEVRDYRITDDVLMKYSPGPLSPEGERRIFYRMPEVVGGAGEIFSVGVEVMTTEGKPLKVIDFAAKVRGGKHGGGAPLAAWAPDGKLIAFTSAVDGETTELVVADVETGTAQVVATMPAVPSMWYATGPLVQWEGRRVLAGRSVVDLDSGKVVLTLPEQVGIRWLSPDGQYVLTGPYEGWGRLAVFAVHSGEMSQLGHGLPVGWTAGGRALIIRWDAYPYRYNPPGL